MEALLTFLLVFVVFTATDQARAQSTAHLPILAPAAIGFAVFVCHLAGVALDGCSINREDSSDRVALNPECRLHLSCQPCMWPSALTYQVHQHRQSTWVASVECLHWHKMLPQHLALRSML